MDSKTAFEVAMPNYVARILENTTCMGGSLREMAVVEGEANFENVESTFPFTKCIRHGSVDAPKLSLQMEMQMLWNVDQNWKAKHMGVHLESEHWGSRQVCSFTWADSSWSLSQRKKRECTTNDEGVGWEQCQSLVEKHL